MGNQSATRPMTSRAPKVQTHDLNTRRPQNLENSWRSYLASTNW